MNSGWVSIDTAPAGKPILTDDGLVIRDDSGRWVHCDRSGNSFSCADNGVYDAQPLVWVEAPACFYD
jgi:hypothetical protein